MSQLNEEIIQKLQEALEASEVVPNSIIEPLKAELVAGTSPNADLLAEIFNSEQELS